MTARRSSPAPASKSASNARRSTAAVALLALVAAAGCGGDRRADDGVPRAPADPAPEVQGVPGDSPPPAWLETERGSFWLGYSSFCWGGTCADYIAPSCDEPKHTPKLVLRRGETVTAHLAFEPTRVELPLPHGARKLEPSRTPSWRVDREGTFSLFTVAPDGDASYVACVTFD